MKEYGFEKEIKMGDEALFAPVIESIAYYEATIVEINELIAKIKSDCRDAVKLGRFRHLKDGKNSESEGLSDEVIVEQVISELEENIQGCRDAIESDRANVNLNKPFGYCNNQWETLKSMYRDGDKILHCSSPEWTWNNFVGREWVELHRDGESIYFIILGMS